MPREEKPALAWQSKAILLLVVPWIVLGVLFQSYWWTRNAPVIAWTTLGISAVFGLIVWRMRAGTLAAAATGAAITASLMYSTARYPYATSWMHGGLMPLLAVFLLTYAATKAGKSRKDRLGTGESKHGRNAAQVAANLGIAALTVSSGALLDTKNFSEIMEIYWIATLAALCEAAADTVSSEIGQVFGGNPRMLTTFRRVEAGVDGGMTLAGTAAGIAASAIVAIIGTCAFSESWTVCCICTMGGALGMIFDSLLGATVERKGWLNNDAVNFLSTMSAPIFSTLGVFTWFVFFPQGTR